jgi:hypothetical protein
MEIAESVLLSLHLRDNEKISTFITPPSTGLSGTQYFTFNNAGINDPERPEKI